MVFSRKNWYCLVCAVSCAFVATLQAQPSPSSSPNADPEWAALTEQLKRPDLAGLQAADRIPLARLMARGRTRGEWLVAQAEQWNAAASTIPPDQVNRTIEQFTNALPSVRDGSFGATDAEVKKWQGMLAALKVLAKTLLDLAEPTALKTAILNDSWVAPAGTVSNADWVKLWGRGLDTAELAKLDAKGPQLKFPKPISDLFKTIEGPATPTFVSSSNTLVKLQNEQAGFASDPLTRNVLHIALALHGRAVGADEAMLANAGLRTVPATPEAWLAVAGEFESVSAWRWAALARMLAAFSSGTGAASLSSDYQQRFAAQSRTDQRILQWLSGAGRGAGLAPFGVSLKYDTAGAAERSGCAGATGDGFLTSAQSAKAVILGGVSGSPATSATIQSIIAGNKGALVEIVQTGPGQYTACMVGKAGSANATFSTPSDLFARIASWRGAEKLDGVLIAPDRGIWPDGSWYSLCKQSGAATWFAIIPSSGAVVRGGKWNQEALLRLYYLDQMLRRGSLPKLPSLDSYRPGAGAMSQRGFTQINLRGPSVSGSFEAWDTRMTDVSGKAEFPFMVWQR